MKKRNQMVTRFRFVMLPVLGLCSILNGLAQVSPAEPVGIVLSSADGRLVRRGASNPLRPGDLLYVGDFVQTSKSGATFLYCPGKSSLTLAPSTEAQVESSQVAIQAGKLELTKRVMACYLPANVRLAQASRQTYGTLVARGEEEVPLIATPRQKWPAGLEDEIRPLELALAVTRDPEALLARAALYEKYGLVPDAILDYRELNKVWTNVGWIQTKLTELNQALAIRRASQSTVYSGIKQ